MSVFDGVKIGNFTLHSGSTSPVLFDVPAMLSVPEDRQYVGLLLSRRMAGFDYDHIVGVEFGGALLAMLFVDRGKHVGFLRKDGTIIGVAPKSRCILIDDVATTGASLAEAQVALEAAGHKVVEAIALIDRRTP